MSLELTHIEGERSKRFRVFRRGTSTLVAEADTFGDLRFRRRADWLYDYYDRRKKLSDEAVLVLSSHSSKAKKNAARRLRRAARV